MRERLKQIEEQAQQIQDEASLERELTLILGRLDEFAARVKTGLHEADWPTRREIIRALVKRVEIDQEQVRVVFRVNPPPQAPRPRSEKDAQSLPHCRGRGITFTHEYCSARHRNSDPRSLLVQRRPSSTHPLCRRPGYSSSDGGRSAESESPSGNLVTHDGVRIKAQ